MSPSRPRVFLFLLILAMASALAGCRKSESYSGVALGDPHLAEFSELLSVDRSSLGLPALPPTANVTVERSNGSSYDAMLHVYAKHQHRTIAFRRERGKLKWIHEQVIVDGPRKYATVDGTFNEQIDLTYETSRVAHYKLNQLNISYSGPDPVLSKKNDPSLADVKPLPDQWLQLP